MPFTFYHRTTVAEARRISREGFEDQELDLGLYDAKSGEDVYLVGVWLLDQPVDAEEGLEGDALVSVTVDTTQDEMAKFELEGVFWDRRMWVAPAEWLNPRMTIRIEKVDPRSSGFWDAAHEDNGP